MSCRYADARSPAELWENVLAGRRGFRRLPAERLRLEDYAEDAVGLSDSSYVREAAVIDGFEVDRVRFRVTGRAYRAADLAHWLALELAADALDGAGMPDGDGLPRRNTGVLVGNTLTGEFSRAQTLRLRWPYLRRVLSAALGEEDALDDGARARLMARIEGLFKEPFDAPNEETLAGGLSNTIAGRIANHFDLGGGGYTVDAACASSLLAAAKACTALEVGDLDVALVGGVDLSLDPFELVGFSRNGALSRGDMRVYDERATGFLPGEGGGFVVLMRHEDALAEGRRIHGLVRGWGISSDGHGGLTRPVVDGQVRALERAYARSGAPIHEVAYFEGHGTGTPVGDETELAALSTAVRHSANGARLPDPRAVVGSVKAILGHTKAAAGVAGLIKATLTLEHGVLPPTLSCERPHARLRGDDAALRALQEAEPWPRQRKMLAGVSGMGFGGINVHLALGAATGAPPRRRLRPTDATLASSAQDAELLVLSAADDQGLRVALDELLQLEKRLSRAELGDLAAELAARPTAERRAALVVERPLDLVDAVARLHSWLDEGVERRVDVGRGLALGRAGQAPRIGYLFSGQGALRDLDGGVWRRRFPDLGDLFATPRGYGDEPRSAKVQRSIVAASLAGLRLLDDLGLEAGVAVGHSLGELTALAWADVVDEDEILDLAAVRGRTMARHGAPGGAMASLSEDAESVRGLLEELAATDEAARDVVIAAENSPRDTVISGSVEGVEAVVRAAKRRGIAHFELQVTHAFHSPLIADAVEPFRSELGTWPLGEPRRRIVSTVDAAPLNAEVDLVDHLGQQIIRPVLFRGALETAAEDGVDLWLEVGPGHALSSLAGRCLSGDTAPAIVGIDAASSSLRGLLIAAGGAFAYGAPVRLGALFDGRFHRPLRRETSFLVNPCELAPLPEGLEDLAAAARDAARAERADAGVADDEVPAPVTAEDDLATTVRQLVAARAELPVAAVQGEYRLLGDLHMSSLIVGQLVAEAEELLELPPSHAMTDYSSLTVDELIATLAARSDSADGDSAEPGDPLPAGVGAWVRPFRVELVDRPISRAPRPREADDAARGTWTLRGADGPLAAALAERLQSAQRPVGDGLVLVLDAATCEDAAASAAQLLDAAEAIGDDGVLAVVHHDSGAGGFLRSLHLERSRVTTVAIELASDDLTAERAPDGEALEALVDAIVVELESADGPVDVDLSASTEDEAGRATLRRRRIPVLKTLAAHELPLVGGQPVLDRGDVLLVSGGGKGIGAECALALGRALGCRLALLGRSSPEADDELRANLERFDAAGVQTLYLRADVCDADAVRAAVAEVHEHFGAVAGLLHSAGVNDPRRVEQLDAEAFDVTLAPKVGGLVQLLDALDLDALRLCVAFGSIIGRSGLDGEAHYAFANERLRRELDRLGERAPQCRRLTLEWSVWGGVGMGQSLGSLEALARRGITAIPIDRGVEMLLRLLAAPLDDTSMVVAGRLGTLPTLRFDELELPLLRFLEHPRVVVPGVELVVDAEVSADTDPYLIDHEVDGERLVPAVLGLEAMAQTARALTGSRQTPRFEDVRFDRPIAIGDGGRQTIRIAALLRLDGAIDLVIRSGANQFGIDCFRARCRFEATSDLSAAVAAEQGLLEVSGESPIALDPERDLYGSILFHRGRFRRLASYRLLRATTSVAEIAPDGAVDWFGGYLPAELLLGDPGARDAVIHSLQASIPYSTLLPVGVDRIDATCLPATESYSVVARERSRNGRSLLYDLDVVDSVGTVRERWRGLELRMLGDATAPRRWPLALLTPYLERRLGELSATPRLQLGLELGPRHAIEPRAASESALHRFDGVARVEHRPDGKTFAYDEQGVSIAVSASRAFLRGEEIGDEAPRLLLTLRGESGDDAVVACDVEVVVARDEATWAHLLGRHAALAAVLAESLGESRDVASSRVWTAIECLRKAGAPQDAPLALSGAPGSVDEPGWILLRSGGLSVVSILTEIDGASSSHVFAFALEAAEATSPSSDGLSFGPSEPSPLSFDDADSAQRRTKPLHGANEATRRVAVPQSTAHS